MNKDFLEIYRESSLFERREQVQPHMSYAHEKERHRVIKEGRIDLLDSALQIPPDGTAGILSKDALRNQKNMLIAAITMFTRSAMDGGLPEELAYAMSDSYILMGEECSTVEEIDRLYNHAFREFTYAVARKGNRHYRAAIDSAIHYIAIHLHEKITLEMVADAVGMSPCHLSRVFRQETGISMVDFVQQERIEAAKHMLIYSDATLSAISQYLYFSTQSYFIRIFKKHVGMTPGQYRQSYRENGEW
ncbi:helix-turn-helix domain-containing protein [Bariatricus sp. SGI.154]|uniref:helix-turn-helix domain-containing protein n=1 Tax=Bariatricus sp. SGI.154 TaxID=3420549 RepID=UPI003CFDB2C6